MTIPSDAAPPRPPRKGRTPRSGEKRIDSPALIELQRRFGADFKAARLAVGMTQAEVARLVDAPYQTIARVEHGRRNLTIDVMQRLAVAVRCSLVLRLNPDGDPLDARLQPTSPQVS